MKPKVEGGKSSKMESHELLESVYLNRVKHMEFTLQQLRSKEYCDVALTVAVNAPIKELEDPIYAHKTILNDASPYFKNLFASAEPQQKDFILIDINRPTLEFLIRSLYNCHLGPIDEENMFTICAGAKLLQLGNIQDTCENFIMSTTKIDNCLQIWSFGKKIECPRLSDPDFILQNFVTVSKIEHFSTLTYTEVQELMAMAPGHKMMTSNDTLVILHQWVRAKDEEETSKRVEVLVSFVRTLNMEQIEATTFSRIFIEDADLYNLPTCAQFRSAYLTQFFLKHMQTVPPPTPTLAINGHAKQLEIDSVTPRKRPRHSISTSGSSSSKSKKVKVDPSPIVRSLSTIVNGGGGESCTAYFVTRDEVDWFINAYEFQTGMSQKIGKFLNYRDHGVLLFTHNLIYYLGGQDAQGGVSNQIDLFDLSTNEWLDNKDLEMDEGRSYTNCVPLNGQIYIVAGYREDICIDSVERIPAGWPVPWPEVVEEEVTNVHWSKYRAPLSVVDGKIYSVGGAVAEDGDEGAWASCFVESYDPVTNQWTDVLRMPTARIGHFLVTHGSKLYALGGGIVEVAADSDRLASGDVYNPKTEKWESISPMHKKRQYGSAVSYGGYIYVIGGDTGKKPTAERYDPKTDTWEMIDLNGSLPPNADLSSMTFHVRSERPEHF